MTARKLPISLERDRVTIAEKVRELRTARRLTQTELAKRLGLSQARLSEIEQGDGSFSAEQLLEILRIFNVPVTVFAPDRAEDSAAQLANVLARLSARHLAEREDVLPSERLYEVSTAIRETLALGTARLVTALAPVLVVNIDAINFSALHAELIPLGLARRFGWLIENTLQALDTDAGLAKRYRRARSTLSWQVVEAHRLLEGRKPRADVLDPTIRSAQSFKEVERRSSPVSQRWSIVTSLKVENFVSALRAALD